jgi:hypothetical protein
MSRMLRRCLAWICIAAGITLIVILVTGGFRVDAGPIRLSAHRSVPPLAVMVLGALALWRLGPLRAGDALASVAADLSNHGLAVGVVCALAIAGVGVVYGTFAASSADPSAYVSHAALLDGGRLSFDEPLARAVDWHEPTWTFTPLGYRPGPAPGVIVPGYPMGLPLVMAAARRVAGAAGPFLVVPLLAAAAVLATYRIASRSAGPVAGVTAAALLASSPIVQFQTVQPMSDVPAMAWWTLALTCALSSSVLAPAAAGLLSGMAVLTRPTLAPLAAVVAAVVLGWPRAGVARSFNIRRLAAFAVGLVPAALLLAWLQQHLYGSPLRSGYGDVSDFFHLANIWPNVGDYSGRLLVGEAPALILAVCALAVLLVRRQPVPVRSVADIAKLAAALAAILLAIHLPYGVFPDWAYLRFLLPGLPLAFATLGALVALAVERLPPTLRGVALVAALTLVVSFNVVHAGQQAAYALRGYEARYRTVGLYLAATLPPEAVVVTSQESGSVHHYTSLPVVRWDLLTGDLEEALARLRALGRHPVLVVEDWEKPALRARFPSGPTASLDWKPRVETGLTTRVGVWDPADRTN